MLQITSQPCEIRLLAASFSALGSNHEFKNIAVHVILGLMDCAPSKKPFAAPTISGTGKAPKKPMRSLLLAMAAAAPATYEPSKYLASKMPTFFCCTMPAQCSNETLGKRWATRWIGVPCEKLVPKMS